ncbi:MAG TPA: Gfo/Idh/MocA family oxidoreductase [Planctomycetia bacterium]|nr:Gfo/Idh/MocA family oxidoreductase [Planctomycetia bacterium]
MQEQGGKAKGRRDFVRGAATAAGATLASGLIVPAVHAGGTQTLKVGLVGCGGRGSGAAVNAMNADPHVKLHALGDLFRDQLDAAKPNLKEAGKDQFDVADDRCFDGFDAYKRVVDCCDVVLLATPPGFRPLQLRYAVEQGKHVFFEKPVAVDAPGIRSVIESGKIAMQKGLSLCSGFCYRFNPPTREWIKRIHDGAIGKIVTLQATYNTRGLWSKPRTSTMSDMEFQCRNWLYFTWLSGDHNVEQHVHSIDKAMWLMHDEPPVRAVGLGGRQVRVDPQYGHIFDHHAVIYEFANGVRCYSFCRQQDETKAEDSDIVFGTIGRAVSKQFNTQFIEGANPWKATKRANPYLVEHQDFFATIRSGNPMNAAEAAAKSTMMAIMGRMATYTGQEITWDMAMNSKEDLAPPKYELGSLPTPPVALPGKTKFA